MRVAIMQNMLCNTFVTKYYISKTPFFDHSHLCTTLTANTRHSLHYDIYHFF